MAQSESSTYKRFLLISFLVFLVLHIVIFRSVIFNIIDIWSGDKIVAAEELIPIFDFKSQYLDQLREGYSPLTDNYELRIRYSALTTWVRHHNILPVALVVMNALSAWVLSIAAFLLVRQFFPQGRMSSLAVGAITAAMVI